MADVTLTVALQPTADLGNIESQIDGLLKGFEGKKRPLRIDFELSKSAQASLDRINTSLTQIQAKALSTASAMKQVNNGINGEDTKKQEEKTQSAYKQALDAAKKYYSTLERYKKLDTDIFKNDNGVYQSKSGKWSVLATELNDVSRAFNNIEKAKKNLSPQLSKQLDADLSALKRKYDLENELRNNKKTTSDEAKRADQEAKSIAEQEKSVQKILSLQKRIDNMRRNYTASAYNNNTKDAFGGLENRSRYIDDLIGRLNNGSITLEQFNQEYKQLQELTAKDEKSFLDNGTNRKSFVDNFKNMAAKFGTWLTASQVIMASVRTMKAMVKEAIAVDDAMTQMQIVTKASSGQMEQFGDTAAKVAKNTASSMTDIISSATTYARLGYDMNTSTTLAEYTSMISKVGDINVADVQSAVTAIVKAFKIDATDTAQIQSVFDKLIVTGNNLPVSVSELAEGLNNAASSLAAGGNSYEESLAMLAASNATVQDISKSSTGLRTIVARIRNTKTELDSLGESMTDAEYNKIVEALTGKGVSLTDANGNLRDTFDILDDIARVSKDLKANSPNDYAALAETLAGTRMQNVFFSIVENWDEAKKAMDLMGEDSLGALDTAFGTYEESISAHVQKFKTQFQDLSTTVVGSDFAKGIVDIGTGLLSFATATLKLAGTLPTLASLVAIIKTIQSAS